MSNLANAHADYVENQQRQHNHHQFFRCVDALNEKASEFSSKLDEKLENADNFLGGKAVERFGALTVLPSLLDKGWDLAVIPTGDDDNNLQSLGDMFGDLEPDQIKSFFDGLPDNPMLKPLKSDLFKGFIVQCAAGGHKPSELFSLKSCKDFVSESLISKDGVLHSLILGGAMAVNPLLGTGVMIATFAYNAGSALLSLRKTYVERKAAKGQQKRLVKNIARMNAATGHGYDSHLDGEAAAREFMDKLNGKKLSAEEIAGIRAYLEEKEANRVGQYISGDLDGKSAKELNGYRLAMGVAAGAAGAAALQFLMNHGGIQAAGESLLEVAGDVSGVGGGGSSAVPGVVEVSGSASVRSIKSALLAIAKEVQNYQGRLNTYEGEITKLGNALHSYTRGTNDSDISAALSQLQTARTSLRTVSQKYLPQVIQLTKEYATIQL